MRSWLRLERYNTALLGAIAASLLCNVLLVERKDYSSLLVEAMPSLVHAVGVSQSLTDEEVADQGDLENQRGDLSGSKIRKDGDTYKVVLDEGDTLEQILGEIKVEPRKSHLVARAVNNVYKLTKLRAGEELQIVFESQEGVEEKSAVKADKIIIDLMDTKIEVVFDVASNSFRASIIPAVLETKQALVKGKLKSNFLHAAKSNGVPREIAADFVRIFSHEVDFQRDLGLKGSFAVLYEYKINEKGKKVKNGKILYAALEAESKKLKLYRHEFSNGVAGYFYEDGSSAKKALLRTPVKSSCVSSGYGMRKHPILGYSVMHRGLDYAAPKGTPVLASGDGVVEVMRYHSTYGRYIKIKHDKRHTTLYAHLARFAEKIGTGTRVSQGQIVGYVGSTGMSTGPHLHYEVHIDGRQVNPAKVAAAYDAFRLSGHQLVVFRLKRDKIQDAVKRGVL